jgi:predicted protein tyrosine phosphatase
VKFTNRLKSVRDGKIGTCEYNTIVTDNIVAIVGIDEIIEIIPPANTVLISIIDPKSEPLDQSIYDRYEDYHISSFWDILKSQEAIDNTGYHYKSISIEQAKEIKEFILKHKGKQFIIHCFAGISRSAAIGQALTCLIDHNADIDSYLNSKCAIKKHWRYHPNKTVRDTILNVDLFI